MTNKTIKHQISQGLLSGKASNMSGSVLLLLLGLSPLSGCGGAPDQPAAAEESALTSSDPIRIAYGSDPLQYGDLRVPQGHGPFPVAVVLHGGCWFNMFGLELMDSMSTVLTQNGIATWNIEYRRVGDPGGGYPNTFTDVGQAVDKLRDLSDRYHLNLDEVVAVGHSAGGELGTWAAARPKLATNDPLRGHHPLHLAATVPLAGIFDMAGYYNINQCGDFVGPFMGGSPTDVPARYIEASPIKLLPIGVPEFIVHGTADQFVPLVGSEQFKAAALAAGDRATLTEVPDADHFDMITTTSTKWPQVQGAILQAFHDCHGGQNGQGNDNGQGNQNGQGN